MKYQMTLVEQMFLEELAKQRNELLAPINDKINKVTGELILRLGIKQEDIESIDVGTGEVIVREVPAQEEVLSDAGDI